MGDYASASDIVARFPVYAITTASTPSTSHVDGFIDLVEDEVNGLIKSIGYTPPITSAASPVSFGVIKQIVINGAAAMTTENLLFAVGNEGGKLAQTYATRYSHGLDALRKNPAMLRDATESSEYSGRGLGQAPDTTRWPTESRDDNDDINPMFSNEMEY